MTFTDRIALLEFCNTRFPQGIAVEIGMASGCFTKQILASWPTLGKLHCVDSWRHFDSDLHDACNLDAKTQEERYQQVMADFKDNPKVNIIRATSIYASQSFDDQSVDFIYLDANHSYTSVWHDLDAWWRVLKDGGLFSGHDYEEGDGQGHGVKKAVDEFARRRELKVGTTTQSMSRKEAVYGECWEGTSFVLRK